MFGFIWVLLEKIATKILKDQLGIMERGLVTRERDIERLEEIADARRSDLIELRAKLDREIESLQQTMREQAKCIEQQEEAMRDGAKCIEQQAETIRVLRNINSAHEDREKKAAERVASVTEHNLKLRQKLEHLKTIIQD